MFSKACEYGIRAAIYIAGQSAQGQRPSLKDVAREAGAPAAFTAKILQTLSRSGIIHAVKGPGGGYSMGEASSNLARLVAAIDGADVYLGCGLGLEECDASRPCPMHHKFGHIREELREMLENTTISELAGRLEEGLAFLKR